MRTHVQVLLAALLVVIGGWVGYALVFGPDATVGLTLIQVDGQVTRTDAQGTSRGSSVGTPLEVRDTLAVGEGSQAVLGIGDATRITIGASSEVRILDVDADGVRVELEQGRVSARVAPGSPAVDVASRGRTVRTDQGAFTIVADDDGTVAVDATEGTVALDGFDGTQALGGGQRISAVPDQPAVVGAIPDGLLLEVSWPDPAPQRAPETPLKGRTEPFARVRVGQGEDWETVRAGPDGQFEVIVPLAEGANPLTVEATDPAGAESRTDGVIQRDTTAPVVTSTEVVWGG